MPTITATLILVGLATYYNPAAGASLRSGELAATVDLADVVAVDDSHWPTLSAAQVLICSRVTCEQYTVQDTGRLYDAGRFTRRRGRYRPDPTGLPVVADLPPQAMRRISPNLDTVPVTVYLQEEHAQ
jgi:hypothetical protein